jgi:hypothetical protein
MAEDLLVKRIHMLEFVPKNMGQHHASKAGVLNQHLHTENTRRQGEVVTYNTMYSTFHKWRVW